jgi:hypothetical protein
MEAAVVVSAINQGCSGGVLRGSASVFEPSVPELWVDSEKLERISKFIRENDAFSMDYLKAINVTLLGSVYELSYMVENRFTAERIFLRTRFTNYESKGSCFDGQSGVLTTEMILPCLTSIWKNAKTMQEDVSRRMQLNWVKSSKL